MTSASRPWAALGSERSSSPSTPRRVEGAGRLLCRRRGLPEDAGARADFHERSQAENDMVQSFRNRSVGVWGGLPSRRADRTPGQSYVWVHVVTGLCSGGPGWLALGLLGREAAQPCTLEA